MFFRSQLAARVAIIAIVLGLSGVAAAVAPVGPVKRVDADPGASAAPVYQIGLFFLARTRTGGFAAAWEENSKSESPNPIIWDRIRYRVYGNTFAPVAAPQAADLSGNKRLPTLSGIVPLGTDKAYLFYGLTRDNPGDPDNPIVREAFGQRIALGTGAAFGVRQLLNPPSTSLGETLIGIPAGLSDGRAVFAWYEADEVAPIPGRFISSAGALQPANLNFACCGSGKEAQLVRLQPLGTGFLADYQRNSIFGSNGAYARVFQSNGQPLAAAKYFAVDFEDQTQNVHRNVHVPRALSNGNIAVFRFVPATNPTKLVVQLYSKTWQKIGVEKTLVSGLASTRYVDFAPTLDGGLFMIRTLLNGSVYTRSVRRYNANLAVVGPDYTFASPQFDGFRIAALSSTRAVVLFRNIIGGRHRLVAQIVSY